MKCLRKATKQYFNFVVGIEVMPYGNFITGPYWNEKCTEVPFTCFQAGFVCEVIAAIHVPF